jgi:PAS domain S-box-containing protein
MSTHYLSEIRFLPWHEHCQQVVQPQSPRHSGGNPVTTAATSVETVIVRDSLRAIEDRLLRQRDALVALTNAQVVDCDALPATLAAITRVSAEALAVSRASLWLYDDERTAITCIELFDVGTASHTAGLRLRESDFPNYFRALRDSNVVAVDDAARDPRTSEFTDTYLRPLNIRSMMDAPLHGKGLVVGVLCFEQVETLRSWTTDERTFATAISNLVSLALERCERSKAESTLGLQAAALNAAAHAMIITDCQKRIVWANPAFCQLTGYANAEVIGQDPTVFLAPLGSDPSLFDPIVDRLRQGDPWHGETVNRRKDGTTFLADHFITPVRANGGSISHFVSLRIDLTQRRSLEAQFLQAQKMEVVGRLAGGIAHDFNNMLTVINGMAELSLEQLPLMHPLRDDIQRIFDSGKRAASLTRQLLTYSRKQIANRQPLAVGTALLEFRSILQRLIGEDVRLDVTAAADSGSILADQSQFEQVILNLAVNAKDAMPGGGLLRIDAKPRDITGVPENSAMPIAAGRYVELTVSDSGTGMTPQVAAQIFEPFFTTKEAGKGTGLGLATVYAIVEQSRGSIAVKSEIGRGTTFTIYLPQVKTVAAAGISPMPAATPSGAETVLLVEDDAAVRDFARRALERSGYRVLTAANAAIAAKIAEDLTEPIALLVTDVVMPGVGGRDLARIVTATRPGTRVLFTSGYTNDTVLAHGVRENSVHFIAKPYSPQSLARKVRDVLDGPATAGR